MHLVKQRSAHDCGLACMAMLAGTSYEEIVERFGNRYSVDKGMGIQMFLDTLLELGFGNTQILARQPPYDLREYPLRSGIQYVADVMGHSIVIDADGTIFDPQAKATPVQRLSEYPAVWALWEMVPIVDFK